MVLGRDRNAHSTEKSAFTDILYMYCDAEFETFLLDNWLKNKAAWLNDGVTITRKSSYLWPYWVAMGAARLAQLDGSR